MIESKYKKIAYNYCDAVGGECICPQCKTHFTYDKLLKELNKNGGWVWCDNCSYTIHRGDYMIKKI